MPNAAPADFDTAATQLIEAGRVLHALGMVPATSGNFSARLAGGDIAVTVSGAHKGRLVAGDIMVVSADGVPAGGQRPSAELGLHLQLYRRYHGVNAVLHPHSRCATLTRGSGAREIVLEGYELLKAFEGLDTHDTRLVVPVIENDQDIPRLAQEAGALMDALPSLKAYLIRGHGFYTWGNSVQTALRHCEALEFLLQCELQQAG